MTFDETTEKMRAWIEKFPPEDDEARAFFRGYMEGREGDALGVTYDDDPTSPRSRAYDDGREKGLAEREVNREIAAPYGLEVHRDLGPNARPSYQSVVGRIGKALAGNLVLEVGHSEPGVQGWMKTEHIVMVPQEARAFIEECESVLSTR